VFTLINLLNQALKRILIIVLLFGCAAFISAAPVKLFHLAGQYKSNFIFPRRFPDSGKIDNTRRSKLLAATDCTTTASISGNNCVGSTLSVTSNKPIASVSWVLNNTTTVAIKSPGLQATGVVVAGGNGVGPAANQLNYPDRLTIDKDGNIYIPDLGNNRVQKWAPGATRGITVAGGYGAGRAAKQLNRPVAVALDSQGNIYVSDQGNNRVQKWVPGAASGTTVVPGLNEPTGIFIDANNNLYVAEQFRSDVLKFAPGAATGVVVAGGNAYGAATNQLSAPTGIFVDATGNVYVCDTDNGRVEKWPPGAINGVEVAGSRNKSYLINPLDVWVDLKGNVYVSDYTAGNVQVWAPGAGTRTIIVANGLTNPSPEPPLGIWFDGSGSLYVSDYGHGRVIKYANVFIGDYIANAAGSYTAIVTSTDGCIATSNAIVINDSLVPHVSISSNTTTVCAAFSPVFAVNIDNGGTNPTLQWKINGAKTTPPADGSFASGVLKNGDVVSCDLTSNLPCIPSAIVSSNQITVHSNATETPSVTIASTASDICAGNTVTFTATALNCGPNPIYQWQVNGNNALNSANNPTYTTAQLNTADKVSCIVTSSAPYCQTTSNAVSNSVKVTVNPILTPAITISSNLSTVYTGGKATFTATPENTGTNPSYEWQVNNLTVATNTLTYTAPSLKEGDQVVCKLTNNEVCTTANIVTSNVITVHITIVDTLSPPNAFTPNNDGINDNWDIAGITAFPKCVVNIYSRYGQQLFQSVGYAKPWDGTYDNKPCPAGVYYYVILIDKLKSITGYVTIIR